MPTTPRVFISYSHKDEVWMDRLMTHLWVSVKRGHYDVWSDQKLMAGADWRDEIYNAIEAADIGILLISANFLISEFIQKDEIPRMLDKRRKNGMGLFPVLIRSCDWKIVDWLGEIQIRPKGARPLASFRGDQRDAEMTIIAQEIRNWLSARQALKPPRIPRVSIIDAPDKDTFRTAMLTSLTIAPLHQLPSPPADFTGRIEDLSLLVSEMGHINSIFTLRGMGGIGKTTLALKLAESKKAQYPDAQIYLDLKGTDPQPLTAAQAMAHVIRAFHPESRIPDNSRDLAALYRSVLEGKRALLLMDNAASKEQIEPLIPPPTCLLLITSRFHFTLPTLISRDLGELFEKDAKELLLRIAPRIGDAAEEIAHLCGCLPLALRLAGSALAERPDLSPAEYIRCRREGKKKMEPVEASLQTSYDLLTEERRRLWRLLSVFPDTFDAEAVAAAWALEKDDAKVDLGELVRCSLVDWEEAEGRYRLHDLARAFAVEKITAAEQAEVQRRHAEHFLEVLRSADSLYKKGGQGSRLGLALFDREWSNIRIGQAWAAAQFKDRKEAADLCSGYPGEGIYCLDLRLHPREKILWLDYGIAASQYLGDREAEGRHLGNLGLAYTALGEPRRAIKFYEQWLTIAREIGDRRGEGNGLGNLGLAYAALGEPRRAIEFYEQQITIAREIGDRRGEDIALGSLGVAYWTLGEPRRAIEFYEQGLTIAREIEDRRGEGAALGNLGVAYAALGEPRRAIEFYEQGLTIDREIGDRRGEGSTSWNLGLIFEREGDLAHAADLMQVLVDYELEIGHPDAEKRATQVAALRARIADAARD